MKRTVDTGRKPILCDEKGVALILALWMLVLLSVLGAMATSTAITEMAISGNYRNTETAFNTADAAVEYGGGDPAIYAAVGTGTWTLATLAVGNYTASNVTVTYLSTNPPPVGSGVDASIYQANYFVVWATGTGANNSEARIEAGVAKLVPK